MERPGDLLIDSIADAVAERLSRMTLCRKRLLNLEEAAEYLGLSEDAVRDLIGQGRLETVRLTRKVQIDIRVLDQLIEEDKRSKG